MRIRVMKLAIKRHPCLETAAAALGVTSKTLYNYRIELGLHTPTKKEKA